MTQPYLAKMKFWICVTWAKIGRFGCGPVKTVAHTKQLGNISGSYMKGTVN